LLANLFGIIPLLVVLQFCSVQKQVALLVSPGPRREFCANDIQYALYFVMESAFDFSELDMEHLRRWGCMLLIDNLLSLIDSKAEDQPKDDWRGKTAKTVPGKRTHWQRRLQKKFLSALKKRMEYCIDKVNLKVHACFEERG
ncbi:hypothetical protein JOQ06_009038, partial [Pogonophryne albipinna]